MAVLVILPIWGWVYVQTLEPPEAGEQDVFALGAQVYDRCASCHGANGEGGSGPAFVDGAVVETWPDPLDQAAWVRLGSDGWPSDTYGDQGKPKQGGMPAWADLTDAELAQVVIHERTLAGEEITEDATDERLQTLVAIANGEMTFADAELGPLSEQVGVTADQVTSGG
jgi:mono/diheme cytochrome c family protein